MCDKVPSLADHQPAKAHFVLNGRCLTAESVTPLPPATTISVYSLDGVKVASCEGISIDLSSCPAGVYAVQLNTGEKDTSGSTLIRLK